MRTVLQVVGESDIGLDTSRYKDDVENRRKAVILWRDTLLAKLDEPTGLAAHMRLSRALNAAGDLVVDDRRNVPPLVNLLGNLDLDEEVDLVLVGTQSSDGVPSLEIAETLRIVLDKHPDLLGPSTVVRVSKVAFDIDDIAVVVRDAIREDEPRQAPVVEIAWGPGATGISLAAMSGVIASGRRWQLRRARAPFDEVRLLPDQAYPAAVSWLLRYGYPGRVVEALGTAADSHSEMIAAAEVAQATLERVANGATSVGDLAAWVRIDARRRNRISGLAVRAWIAASYNERAAREGSPNGISFVERRLHKRGLGKAIDTLDRPPYVADPADRTRLQRISSSRSGRWLVDQKKLVTDANTSAHNFIAMKPARLRELQAELGDSGDIEYPAGVGPFHFPTGTVAYLWAEGRVDAGRKSTLATLLESPPPPELLGLVPPVTADGFSPHTLVDLLVVTSRQAKPCADAQIEEASAVRLNRKSKYHFRHEPTSREVPYKDAKGDIRPDTEVRVRDVAEGWLNERDVDAIVVVTTGPKEHATGLVTASVSYGHRRAVPVFIQSTFEAVGGPVTRFHRLLPYLVTNRPALELALSSVRGLAFDTAVALVGLCHPHPGMPGTNEPDVVTADVLRSLTAALDRLNASFFADDATAARERMELCAGLIPTSNIVEQIRLVHVAAEIYDKVRKANGGTGWPSGDLLSGVRNRLSVNHGGRTLTAGLEAAARGLGVPGLTFETLIRIVAGEIPPAPAALAEPLTGFPGILETLERMIDQTRDATNAPLRS